MTNHRRTGQIHTYEQCAVRDDPAHFRLFVQVIPLKHDGYLPTTIRLDLTPGLQLRCVERVFHACEGATTVLV